MPSFAPVYRTPASRQSFLTREQTSEGKRRRKRKREREAEDSDGQVHEDEAAVVVKLERDETEPRVPHPLNRKDAYYVAGWPREEPLPLPARNFPHAAVKVSPQDSLSVEAELGRSNPPIYTPKHTSHDPPPSLRRRHLDNLTAILHKCMLNNDWHRASRTWALILRTSLDGNGPDIRQHGRWMLAAELLMRRHHTRDTPIQPSGGDDERLSSVSVSAISDQAFQKARDYYERLILQYPHRHNTPPSAFSARVVYPALFNIWIYEVQDRSRRAQTAETATETATDASEVDDGSSKQRKALHHIKARELAEASPISHRLDSLINAPPYDAMAELLELRAALGLWISDLHKALANLNAESLDDASDQDDAAETPVSKGQHQMIADQERSKAIGVLQKMSTQGMEMSNVSLAILEEEAMLADASRDVT